MSPLNPVFKNVLLLYKKSAYKIYFLERKGFFKNASGPVISEQIRKFKRAHHEHYRALRTVTQVLIENNINFTESFRGQKIKHDKFDMIITVGGDGTFLEAARYSTSQILLGVNSALSYSVGSFCIANENNFKQVIKKILAGQFNIVPYHRLRVKLSTSKEFCDILNDALICHENPAMMSRYLVKIGSFNEEQKSSGMWISTAAGSSGGVHSAGGKLVDKELKQYQYIPRELYPRSSKVYKLKGAVLKADKQIRITSLMRQGVIYLDGAHHKWPFEYGSTLTVGISPNPIRTIKLR